MDTTQNDAPEVTVTGTGTSALPTPWNGVLGTTSFFLVPKAEEEKEKGEAWSPDLEVFTGGVERVKAAEGEGDFVIEGMASTNEIDDVNEIVEPSAFKGSLRRFLKFPILLFAHRMDEPIGKVLKAEVTDTGLKIRAMISKSSGTAQRVRDLITEGILKAFSIGFRVDLDALKQDEVDGKKVLRITKLDLLEISVVPLPANRGATFAMAKSLTDALDGPKASSGDEPQEEPSSEAVPSPVGHRAAVRALVQEAVESLPSLLAGASVLGDHLRTIGGHEA